MRSPHEAGVTIESALKDATRRMMEDRFNYEATRPRRLGGWQCRWYRKALATPPPPCETQPHPGVSDAPPFSEGCEPPRLSLQRKLPSTTRYSGTALATTPCPPRRTSAQALVRTASVMSHSARWHARTHSHISPQAAQNVCVFCTPRLVLRWERVVHIWPPYAQNLHRRRPLKASYAPCRTLLL